MIGIAPLASKDSILQHYDETKDIEFLLFKESKKVKATPASFFIFFPEDAHMPGLKAHMPGLKEETNAPVRKVVVKVRID